MTSLLRTRQIADANVTLAKIANASASSKLLGSGASGSGAAYDEITLGTNLSMTGTTLNATGGGSSAFNAITGGTNTTAAMVVGSGASLAPTGTGIIAATSLDGTISSTSTATTQSQADNSTKVATTAYVDTGLGAKQDTLTDVNFGSFINGLTAKTTPVDADLMNVVDSADSNKEKKVTWANIKATFLAAFVATKNTFTKQQNFGSAALTSTSNSIAWNLDDAQVASHSATENTTLANPTNKIAGGTYIFTWVQNASAAKTLAFGADYVWPSGITPTVSSTLSSVAVFTFLSDGTKMRGSVVQYNA